jgi:CubicO group peptidase (beta-lactamase class C family)
MRQTRRSLFQTTGGLLLSSRVAAAENMAAPLEPAGLLLENAVRDRFAPGLVGLSARGEEVEVVTAGSLFIGGTPMRRDTIFRIASMTKPITAAAIMMLIDDGKLRLNDPVDRFLPELANRRVLRRIDGPVDDTVPASRAITVEDLLTFRLGWGLILAPPGKYPVQRAIAELGIVGFGPPDPSMPFDSDEWLRRLSTLPLFAQPGEQWFYTTGSDIQGVLIARVSGQSFSTFLAERIFGPLGMRDTGFFVPPAKINRLATAYRAKTGELTVADPPAGGKWSRAPRFEEGDAGLVSTADDYLAFARLLLAKGRHNRNQLLSASAVQAMTTNHLTPLQRKQGSAILGVSAGWGYGMSVTVDRANGEPPPGSFGWIGGFGTNWRSDPARALTSILLSQRELDSPSLAPLYGNFEHAIGMR